MPPLQNLLAPEGEGEHPDGPWGLTGWQGLESSLAMTSHPLPSPRCPRPRHPHTSAPAGHPCPDLRSQACPREPTGRSPLIPAPRPLLFRGQCPAGHLPAQPWPSPRGGAFWRLRGVLTWLQGGGDRVRAFGVHAGLPASGAPGWPLSGLPPGEPRHPAPGPATPSPGPGGAFRREGDWFGLGGRQAGQALVQPGHPLTSGAVANPGSPGLLGVTGGDLGGYPAEPTLRAGP